MQTYIIYQHFKNIMDAAATLHFLGRLSDSTAEAVSVQPVDQTKPAAVPTNPVKTVLSLVIGVALGVLAAYLSWQCNTRLDYHIVWKVINAVVAYLFGLMYILLYAIFRWDVCKKIVKA